MVTPTFLPLRSCGFWIGECRADDQAHAQRLVGEHADRLGRHALGQKTHGRPRAETEVDGVRHHPLLQFGIAGEYDGFDVQIVLRPNAFRRADLDRREGERLADRFADAHLVGGGSGADSQRQHQCGDVHKQCRSKSTPSFGSSW